MSLVIKRLCVVGQNVPSVKQPWRKSSRLERGKKKLARVEWRKRVEWGKKRKKSITSDEKSDEGWSKKTTTEKKNCNNNDNDNKNQRNKLEKEKERNKNKRVYFIFFSHRNTLSSGGGGDVGIYNTWNFLSWFA